MNDPDFDQFSTGDETLAELRCIRSSIEFHSRKTEKIYKILVEIRSAIYVIIGAIAGYAIHLWWN